MLNIGQIGVGYWGPNLLRNLVASKRCKVKCAVDLSMERRGYVRDLYPAIDVSGDSDAVLGDPEIDAVVIATPVATHFDLGMEGTPCRQTHLGRKASGQERSRN